MGIGIIPLAQTVGQSSQIVTSLNVKIVLSWSSMDDPAPIAAPIPVIVAAAQPLISSSDE